MFYLFRKTAIPVILLFTFFFTGNSVDAAACDNGGIINIFSGKEKAGYLAAYNKPGENRLKRRLEQLKILFYPIFPKERGAHPVLRAGN